MPTRTRAVRKITCLTIPCAALLVYVLTSARPVRAAFLGAVGQVSYGRFDSSIGDFQIFVANPDGSHEVQITTVGGEVSDWSADGTRIAHDFFDGATQNVQIVTVNPDGTGSVQLTSDNSFHGEPAWSPDGQVIAFDGGGSTLPSAANGIYLMDSSTGAVLSRVTANPYGQPDGEPRWSPDGQWISFTRIKTLILVPHPLHIRGAGAIFVVRRDGKYLRQLTPWGMLAGSSDWSPDGSTIVFASNEVEIPPPSAAIWTVHPDGSGLTEIVPTVYPAHFHHPKWSPDGKKVIFAGRLDPTQGVNLWTVNADGSNVTKITGISGPLGSVNFPAWGTHALQ